MKNLSTFILVLVSFSILAQKAKKNLIVISIDKQLVIKNLDLQSEKYGNISKQIWDLAELGYLENKSSLLLQTELQIAGFKVEAGVAGLPTAFTATFGSGKPVIGIMAEYDALPGLAQEAVPEPMPIVGQKAGHACGHHLFGAGSMAAAIEVKNYLEKNKLPGTIKLYGTPAEEGGSGKVYMVREKVFSDVDVMLHWHPANINAADASSSLANKTAKFKFYGQAAHAAMSPEQGRSALDGVEAMNNMVNMMREHITSPSRIHYVITKGGDAPNIVPKYAEVYYFVRHPEINEVKNMWSRLQDCAKGAALGTGTKVEEEVISGLYNILPNEVGAKLMHSNLEIVGGVKYNEAEIDFAKKIQATLAQKPPVDEASRIKPMSIGVGSASTDVGDVSWTVPTIGLGAATWVPGTPAHSWQAVACGGMSIGKKGMMIAAKTLAITALDLMISPETVSKIKAEFLIKQGADFKYESLLGNRKPPLDYNK